MKRLERVSNGVIDGKSSMEIVETSTLHACMPLSSLLCAVLFQFFSCDLSVRSLRDLIYELYLSRVRVFA